MNDKQIDALLAMNSSNIEAPVLKAAMEDVRKLREEQQKQNAVRNLLIVQTNTQNAVNTLRAARKEEARAKAYLVALGSAEEAFLKTGDMTAYNVAVSKAALMARM